MYRPRDVAPSPVIFAHNRPQQAGSSEGYAQLAPHGFHPPQPGMPAPPPGFAPPGFAPPGFAPPAPGHAPPFHPGGGPFGHPPAQPKRSWARRFGGWLLLAGALAAAGFGLFWSLQRPVVEAKRFYEHVQKGNTKRAYAMTCPEVREKLDRQALHELLENDMRVYRARSFEVTGVNIKTGAPSCVRGTVVTRDGDRLNASVFLEPSQDYCVIALFSGTDNNMCER